MNKKSKDHALTVKVDSCAMIVTCWYDYRGSDGFGYALPLYHITQISNPQNPPTFSGEIPNPSHSLHGEFEVMHTPYIFRNQVRAKLVHGSQDSNLERPPKMSNTRGNPCDSKLAVVFMGTEHHCGFDSLC